MNTECKHVPEVAQGKSIITSRPARYKVARSEGRPKATPQGSFPLGDVFEPYGNREQRWRRGDARMRPEAAKPCPLGEALRAIRASTAAMCAPKGTPHLDNEFPLTGRLVCSASADPKGLCPLRRVFEPYGHREQR